MKHTLIVVNKSGDLIFNVKVELNKREYLVSFCGFFLQDTVVLLFKPDPSVNKCTIQMTASGTPGGNAVSPLTTSQQGAKTSKVNPFLHNNN